MLITLACLSVLLLAMGLIIKGLLWLAVVGIVGLFAALIWAAVNRRRDRSSS